MSLARDRQFSRCFPYMFELQQEPEPEAPVDAVEPETGRFEGEVLGASSPLRMPIASKRDATVLLDA